MLYRADISFIQSAILPVEPVTYSVRNADDVTFTDYTLQHAFRRPFAKREQRDSSGKLIGGEQELWVLFSDDLTAAGAPEPNVDFKITDGNGIVFMIASVERHAAKRSFDCVTKKAR